MAEALSNLDPVLAASGSLVVLLVFAVIADLIVKKILQRISARISKSNNMSLDDVLVRHNVLGRAAQAVPALIVWLGIEFVPSLNAELAAFLRNFAVAYLVLVVTITLSALLSAVNDLYEQTSAAKERPLRGFIQLFQIIVYVLGVVLIISVLINRSPLLLLSGFGAMTAVVLLVFKDTILGLVASVQLNANDMVRVGDWIEMPKYGADGDIEEVSLHTVKVRNFDRTITTIPTHALISDSFRNWRGMSESGGRRIKRALYVDQNSIRFLTDAEVGDFDRFFVLREYLKKKRDELNEATAKLGEGAEKTGAVNRRRLTNMGTFRAYVVEYLRNHPQINPDATLMVRQLPPGPKGLPLEIYCFTRTTSWVPYEGIQSDIFDHIIAITPEFDLRLFQEPAGSDITALSHASIEAQENPE